MFVVTALVTSRSAVLIDVPPPSGNAGESEHGEVLRSIVDVAGELDVVPDGHLWLQAPPGAPDAPLLVVAAAALAATVGVRVTALLGFDETGGRPADEVADQAMGLVLRTGARFSVGTASGRRLPAAFEERWRAFRPTTGLWRHVAHPVEATSLGSRRDHLALDEEACRTEGASPSAIVDAFRRAAGSEGQAVLFRSTPEDVLAPPGFDAVVVPLKVGTS